MHSEQRPYHREAAAIARQRVVAVIVTELGYLRPDWMTIELNGNSVDSLFPTDPHAITTIASGAPSPEPGLVYPREAGLETIDDLKNSLPNVFLPFLYPHYRAHGLYHPFVAYGRFLRREARRGARDGAARSVRERIALPYFLFAMQTDTDFQIRTNSQFKDTEEALREVFASFAANADPPARLVVKKHPGDLGPVDWARRVPALAQEAGIAERVAFVDGLAMAEWLRDAAGLVTINSSAGLDGIFGGTPTFALSPAIYDVPGLVANSSLAEFWSAPQPPDAELAEAFKRALIASIQVRGTIYSRSGTRAAAQAMADRIASGSVGVPGATTGPPPRHVRAKALGIRS